MENITILSNTCIGKDLMVKLLDSIKYNNPLMAVEIPDQKEFTKISMNIKEYAQSNLTLVTPSKETRYAKQHGDVWIDDFKNYPVVLWKDVELHAYHNTHSDVLDKLNRRLERFRALLKADKYLVISVCSLHENRCDEENIEDDYIIPYMSSSNNDEVHIMVGPSQYYRKEYDDRYIIIKEWDTVSWVRTPKRRYIFGSQEQVFEKALPVVNKYICDFLNN